MVPPAPSARPRPSISASIEPVSAWNRLCCRETGFRDQRQKRRNRLPIPVTHLQRQTGRGIRRQIGAIRLISGNIGSNGTTWWRTQSQSNLSPPPNSLLTGKRTGNFSILDCFPARAPPLVQLFRKVRANFPSYRNREFMGRNREFCFRNREFSPLNPKSPPNEVFGTHREKDHERAQQKQGSRQQGAVHFPPGMRAATPSISVCNVAVITSPLTARPAHEQSRPSEFAA